MNGLLLHSIDTAANAMPISMSVYPTNKFDALLEYLKINNIETKITFDDGLLSLYDNAYPLLEKHNVKAAIFVIAGFIGKVGNWDIMGQTKHLDASMIRELANKGHEIGSHSLTHANLVWLDDKDLLKELMDSRAILENITGIAVKNLSFPFGSWNKRVWEFAKTAGYECATVYRGHKRALPGMLPVFGVYRFDSVTDIADRLTNTASSILSLSSLTSTKTLAVMMSHFAKGAPIVKFRKIYRMFPSF